MTGCCGALAKCGTRFSAAIVLVAGITVLVYGCVLLGRDVNGFSLFVSVVGGYTMLVGSAGVCLSMMTTGKCFTYLYLGLLTIAILFETTVGICLKTDEGWTKKFFLGETCGHMNSTGCGTQVKEAEDFFDNNQHTVFIAVLGALAFQIFAVMFACCFKKTHSQYDPLAGDNDEALIDNMEQGGYGYAREERNSGAYNKVSSLRSGAYNSPDDRMSESRAHANKLREKYGLYAGGRASSGYYSDNSERGM